MITHDHSPCSGLDELERRWCLDDVLKAHDVLDAIEDAEARMRRKASRG